MEKELYEMTFKEFKMYISKQANKKGNSVTVDDFSADGMSEYSYPYNFTVDGIGCRWNMNKNHTKGKFLTTHYELWGHSPLTGSYKVATGTLTKGKLFKFFKELHKQIILKAIREGKVISVKNLTQYKISA